MQPTGYILWQGPSKLDGSPIAAVATLGSDNRKTGDMVQTYILRTDMPPGEAVRSGADAAVCGNCKLRPYNGGGCYVVIYHGPRSVYAKLERGGYLMAGDLPALGRGCTVRLGSYGDPAAVPSEIWRDLISEADGHTGYTHQWRNSQDLRDFLMASVDSPEEREEALARGWRTFRVRAPGQELEPLEFTCPASEEAGKLRTCASCKACDGASAASSRKASPVIIAHGHSARRFHRLNLKGVA